MALKQKLNIKTKNVSKNTERIIMSVQWSVNNHYTWCGYGILSEYENSVLSESGILTYFQISMNILFSLNLLYVYILCVYIQIYIIWYIYIIYVVL